MNSWKGFKEDEQFRTEEDETKAAKDLSEYEEGESVWKKEEIEGVIYIQLKKPGYACNPQEFVENKIFVSRTKIDSRHTLMDFRLIISIAKMNSVF